MAGDPTIDLGLTHVALGVVEAQPCVDFYETYAGMEVVHRRDRDDDAGEVVWLSDRTRPFVIVLIEQAEARPGLTGFCHLGVGVESRDEVDRRLQAAAAAGFETMGPLDYGAPVGYWGIIVDPAGNQLELSFGQEVGLTVEAVDDFPAG